MMFLILIVFSAFGASISATESAIDRQNDNYDSLNRYKPTDTSSYSGSSYGTSGGYYPRNLYEQLNQNRYNADLSGREFRPPNVFATGLMASPYVNPLVAQPRQYQISVPGPSGLLPYQVSGSPLFQSPGYNSPVHSYGGVLSGLRIGDSVPNIGQGYEYGNLLSNPYYGMGNRQSLAFSQPNHLSPYSMYSAHGLYSSPYSSQLPNYQPLGYANPTSGYLNIGPQFAGHPYQTQPYSSGHLGSYTGSNGYNNYNNYNNNYNGVNSNTGLGSGLGTGLTPSQSGVNESTRDERNYASSASTQTETHSGAQTSNETPVFHSNRIIKRNDLERSDRNRGHFTV